MSYLIEQLILRQDLENYDVDGLSGSPNRLENLAQINIFVGENNSGKSRLIRGIARNENNIFEPRRTFLPNQIQVRNLKNFVTAIADPLRIQLEQHQVTSVNQIFVQLHKISEKIDPLGLVHQKSVLTPLFSFLETQTVGSVQSWERNGQRYSGDNANVAPILQNWAKETLNNLQQLRDLDIEGTRFQHIYIPTLRSLRTIAPGDLLMARTRKDYNLPESVEIFTGQTLYNDIENLLRGTHADRNTLRTFEEWLSKSFFNGKRTTLIPRKDHDTLTIKVGDEHEKPIHELGDGIQSILILTFPLFRKEDEYVLAFIEEPELFLHPWLQRIYLEVLAHRFPKHQYFLTTHSNHFLDLTLDVEDVTVFTLEKELEDGDHLEKQPRFRIKNLSREDRKPLELLGVRNSSVLLSNCTIWVEGITDRRYLAHWLSLYDIERLKHIPEQERPRQLFHEDLNYSFVEYGGGNITHFSFLDEADGIKGIAVARLCSKLFLVTDQDGAKEKTAKGRRQEILKERLGDRYYCLPCREIENLSSPTVLARVLESYGDRFKNNDFPTQESYASKPLGAFLESKIALNENGTRNRTANYSQESGTVSDKLGFCKRALEATHSWDDVSPSAQELTQKIFDFIATSNHRK